MKPIIGILGKSDYSYKEKSTICVFDNYRKAIIRYGGIPILILPPQLVDYEKDDNIDIGHLNKEEMDILNRQLELCDGILIQGGTRRFDYDIYVIDYANKNKIPLLGICMGMQTMCNYNNDNQNIINADKIHKSPNMDVVHEVTIDKDSKLYQIIQKEKIMVNSNHGYHVPNSGSYKVCGKTNDIIEAIEKDNYFNIGVQWHPEKKYEEEASSKLFNAFIEESKKNSISKNPL